MIVILAFVQILRGTVVSAETAQPIAMSIVFLQPHAAKQFTDQSGAFTLAAVPPGTYVLGVRQIGYVPLDTQVTVRDGATTIRIALRRLAIELPPVTISTQPCERPGPPDSSDVALRAVFDQLQENARRFELLADSYPFRYVLELSERTVSLRGDTGPPEIRRLTLSSEDNHPYAVGRVVEPGWGPWGRPGDVLVIHSAELQDLGNRAFIANHCFSLAGRDTIAGDTLIRIDFDPGPRIGSADMRGAAYLDPITYELRYTTTSLTRPERSPLTDVNAMTFRTRFRNIAPGVPLQDALTVVTSYRYGRRAKIDTQRTVEVRFRRPPPQP